MEDGRWRIEDRRWKAGAGRAEGRKLKMGDGK
jgi:hypothetical protein